MISTIKKYRLISGNDIENYVRNYCPNYPDYKTDLLLKRLSTRSLLLAYLHVSKNKHLSPFYRNLNLHLYLLLEKKNSIINGSLVHDFEDDSHLEIAPSFYL